MRPTGDAVDTVYHPNADDPSRVVAFDTDLTVSYAGGPVPLEHVIRLREDPDVLVWSTGYNQTLRDRAKIPGMYELKNMRGIDSGHVERANRMRLLKREYPDAGRYDVVDDVDLRELEADGWRYYHPIEYTVEELGITPSRVAAEAGIDVSDYLARIGRFRGQFPPSLLDLTTDQPYTERTRGGVGTPRDRTRTPMIDEDRFRDDEPASDLFGGADSAEGGTTNE